MNSKYSIHYNKIIHSIHKYIHNNITGNSSAAQLKPCSEHNLPMVELTRTPIRSTQHTLMQYKLIKNKHINTMNCNVNLN